MAPKNWCSELRFAYQDYAEHRPLRAKHDLSDEDISCLGHIQEKLSKLNSSQPLESLSFEQTFMNFSLHKPDNPGNLRHRTCISGLLIMSRTQCSDNRGTHVQKFAQVEVLWIGNCKLVWHNRKLTDVDSSFFSWRPTEEIGKLDMVMRTGSPHPRTSSCSFAVCQTYKQTPLLLVTSSYGFMMRLLCWHR